MKTHTEAFKIAIGDGGRQIQNYIVYGATTLTSQLYSINYSYDGNILKSVMKQLVVESSVDIPINTEINWTFGVYTSNAYELLDMGNYVVVKSEYNEDTKLYTLTCYDKIIFSMKDYEDMNLTYPMSVRDYISAICEHLGLTFANINDTNFANWNRQIPDEKYLDSNGNGIGYTFRDVLDELAEVTASTICINNDDQLEIRYINNTLDTITGKHLKDVNVKFGEVYGPVNSIVLSRSAGSDNVHYPATTPENPIEIKISDNQIMNGNDRSDYLPDIYAKLNGLQYCINDFSSTGICYYDVCDRYTIQIGENSYSCVMFNDEIDISGGLVENVYTNMPEQSETDYSKSDVTDRKINQTYLIVDKQNQTIQSVVSNVSEQNNKISEITQTVDELNQKIEDIADITAQAESSNAVLQFEDINASEPISIVIHPITTNISYLYPRNNLYPSDTLYMTNRILRFTNTTTNEVFDYELPEDLLYIDSNTYDEFHLYYETTTCEVVKKCAYASDGTVTALNQTETHTYTYPTILLTDGDYTVELVGYNQGYINVRLVASNIYTSQFATKVEMSSAITQTSNQIMLEVNEKVDNEDYTHAKIVAKINDDTSQILIEADKIDLNANDIINLIAGNTINLTSKAIAINSTNFKVTTAGNLTATNANITGTITANSGQIGGAIITSDVVRMSDAGFSSNTGKYAFWAGESNGEYGSANTNATFKVDHYGNLIASNVDIEGNINATSGTFNGSVNIYSGDTLNCYTTNGNRSLKVDNSGVSVYGGAGTYCGSLSPMIGGDDAFAIGLRSPNGSSGLSVYNTITQTTSPYGMYAYSFNQMCLESKKKNITKFNGNALNIIENGELYTYNYKVEDDKTKEHIGFVIGDLGGKYKTPKEVISNDGKGIDTYAMLSILWKAIQEQQEQIEELKKEINKLKGEK